MILMALLLQAASADTAALSREVAQGAGLVRILPMIASKESEELVKDHPELSAAEASELRATGQAVAAESRATLIGAMAPAYAAALTPEEMRAIVAFEASDAAKARQAAELPAMMAAAKALNGFDYKGAVTKAFCAKTGKACSKK